MRKVLALACLAALAACSSPDTPTAGHDPTLSIPTNADRTKNDAREPECRTDCAPDFAVTSFEGDRFDLGDHAGRIVVINFFESW